MLNDSMTLENLTPEDVATLRELMLQLLKSDDGAGAWKSKVNVRQMGCDIHISYANTQTVHLDGMGTSNLFVDIMLQAPDQLWVLLVKLFDVGDEDTEALLEEARATEISDGDVSSSECPSTSSIQSVRSGTDT